MKVHDHSLFSIQHLKWSTAITAGLFNHATIFTKQILTCKHWPNTLAVHHANISGNALTSHNSKNLLNSLLVDAFFHFSTCTISFQKLNCVYLLKSLQTCFNQILTNISNTGSIYIVIIIININISIIKHHQHYNNGMKIE